MKNMLSCIVILLLFVLCVPLQVQAEAHDHKVAIILLYGLGDESFNDSAYRGATEAREDYDFTLSYVEPEEIAEVEDHMRGFAEDGYDLIIAVGFLQETALEDVAPDYPETMFAIVDGFVEGDNVTALTFKEHEGSFLVGALAGLMTESQKVGFVGGLDVPIIKRFQVGFEEGVAYANPQSDVLVSYAGSFNDPGRGKELALSQAAQGADIIFHASGGTGIGVIEAAVEMDILAIGVDSDQDGMAPGYVLTSMLKRVDVAVYSAIEDLLHGVFKPGVMTFGIADDGVGMTDFEYTRHLVPQEVFDTLEEIKDKIEEGVIQVTDPTL